MERICDLSHLRSLELSGHSYRYYDPALLGDMHALEELRIMMPDPNLKSKLIGAIKALGERKGGGLTSLGIICQVGPVFSTFFGGRADGLIEFFPYRRCYTQSYGAESQSVEEVDTVGLYAGYSRWGIQHSGRSCRYGGSLPRCAAAFGQSFILHTEQTNKLFELTPHLTSLGLAQSLCSAKFASSNNALTINVNTAP